MYWFIHYQVVQRRFGWWHIFDPSSDVLWSIEILLNTYIHSMCYVNFNYILTWLVMLCLFNKIWCPSFLMLLKIICNVVKKKHNYGRIDSQTQNKENDVLLNNFGYLTPIETVFWKYIHGPKTWKVKISNCKVGVLIMSKLMKISDRKGRQMVMEWMLNQCRVNL